MKINEPEVGKRYLVLIKCKRGMHVAVARNFEKKCCDWNVLYYCKDARGNPYWEWSSEEPLRDDYTPLAWTDLPPVPKELMLYEN